MQIKVDFNAHRGIEYIFEKLPGKKCLLDVSSRFPKDIISCYHDHARSHDTARHEGWRSAWRMDRARAVSRRPLLPNRRR